MSPNGSSGKTGQGWKLQHKWQEGVARRRCNGNFSNWHWTEKTQGRITLLYTLSIWSSILQFWSLYWVTFYVLQLETVKNCWMWCHRYFLMLHLFWSMFRICKLSWVKCYLIWYNIFEQAVAFCASFLVLWCTVRSPHSLFCNNKERLYKYWGYSCVICVLFYDAGEPFFWWGSEVWFCRTPVTLRSSSRLWELCPYILSWCTAHNRLCQLLHGISLWGGLC